MKLPPVEAVARMLGDLLGRPCSVQPTAKPGFAEQGFIGVLVDKSGTTRALTFSDKAFTSLAGAALALIPRAVADDAIRSGAVPANLRENHQEIINISTALFNAVNTESEHVRLTQLLATGPAVPQAIRTLLVKPAARMDLAIEISGYGTGKLCLLV